MLTRRYLQLNEMQTTTSGVSYPWVCLPPGKRYPRVITRYTRGSALPVPILSHALPPNLYHSSLNSVRTQRLYLTGFSILFPYIVKNEQKHPI